MQITFDPAIFPYEKLLGLFWQQIDPTDAGGQFHDRGSSYKTAIFYHSDQQKEAAEVSKAELATSGIFNKPIVTKYYPATTFYEAEENIRITIRRCLFTIICTKRDRAGLNLSVNIGKQKK